MVHDVKVRIPEQGQSATSDSEFLYRLPLDLQFNLGLTNAQEGTRRLAHANLKLAIARLSHRDQQVIRATLNMTPGSTSLPMTLAQAIPTQVKLQDRLRFRRSSGAFKRLAQMIVDGPEQNTGPAPQTTAAVRVVPVYLMAS